MQRAYFVIPDKEALPPDLEEVTKLKNFLCDGNFKIENGGKQMRLMQFQIDDIIKTALLEDINYIDVTTDYLVDENSVSTAKYVSKDEGVLCGIDVAMRVFQLLDSNVKCEIFIHDGEKVKKGDIIARITGSTRALLKGERTALNIVQHMSGVATATNRCVELVKGTKASVADTRKNAPRS